jgi:hypothetical protein
MVRLLFGHERIEMTSHPHIISIRQKKRSFIISMHLFDLLFLRWSSPPVFAYFILCLGWGVVVTVVIIGPLALQKPALGPYFGISGVWCGTVLSRFRPRCLKRFTHFFSSSFAQVLDYSRIPRSTRDDTIFHRMSFIPPPTSPFFAERPFPSDRSIYPQDCAFLSTSPFSSACAATSIVVLATANLPCGFSRLEKTGSFRSVVTLLTRPCYISRSA